MCVSIKEYEVKEQTLFLLVFIVDMKVIFAIWYYLS